MLKHLLIYLYIFILVVIILTKYVDKRLNIFFLRSCYWWVDVYSLCLAHNFFSKKGKFCLLKLLEDFWIWIRAMEGGHGGLGVYHPVSRFFQMAKSGRIDWQKFLFDSLSFLHRVSARVWVFQLISLLPITIFVFSFIIRGALTKVIQDFIAVQYFPQMCKRWTISSPRQHFNTFIPKNVRFCQK